MVVQDRSRTHHGVRPLRAKPDLAELVGEADRIIGIGADNRAKPCDASDLLLARIGEVDDDLDEIVAKGNPVTAGRTIAYARACYSWAEKRGMVPLNPFRNLPVSAA